MEQWKVEMSNFKKAVESIAGQLKHKAESFRRHAITPIIDEHEYTIHVQGKHVRAILEAVYGKDVENQIRKETPVDPDYAHYSEADGFHKI